MVLRDIMLSLWVMLFLWKMASNILKLMCNFKSMGNEITCYNFKSIGNVKSMGYEVTWPNDKSTNNVFSMGNLVT